MLFFMRTKPKDYYNAFDPSTFTYLVRYQALDIIRICIDSSRSLLFAHTTIMRFACLFFVLFLCVCVVVFLCVCFFFFFCFFFLFCFLLFFLFCFVQLILVFLFSIYLFIWLLL